MPLVIPNFALNVPYISMKTSLVALILTPIVLPLLRMIGRVVRARFSNVRILPGPSGGNFVLGHLWHIRASSKAEWHEQMLKEYGHVLRYKAILGVSPSSHMYPIC